MSKNEKTYCRTAEMIEALEEFSKRSDVPVVDMCIANYLACYFKQLDNPQEEKYPDIYNVKPYLPVLLLNALETFDSSDEEWVVEFRNFFQKQSRSDASPKSGIFLEDCSISGTLLRHNFTRVMREAMPEYNLEYSLLEGAYLAAQVYFHHFIREVYIGQGMHERIMSADKKGIGGVFGKTDLLTYDVAGRLLFTFARDDQRITFIKESEDPLALGAGIQSCNTDLATALTMITDVIEHYKPEDFVEDCGICII